MTDSVDFRHQGLYKENICLMTVLHWSKQIEVPGHHQKPVTQINKQEVEQYPNAYKR